MIGRQLHPHDVAPSPLAGIHVQTSLKQDVPDMETYTRQEGDGLANR